jgi:hypothetical protein
MYALGMATLASVTRPEGLGLLALLLAYNWFRRPHKWADFLTIPLVLLIPWLVFSYFYFGSILPNSVPAKMALYGRFGKLALWDTLVYLMGWHTPFGWLLIGLALIGGYWLNKKQNFGGLEIIWLVGTIVFYIVARARLFFWYVVPIYPIYLLFAMAAFPFVFDRLSWLQRKEGAVRAGLVAGLTLLLAVGCYRPLSYYREWQDIQDRCHKSVGLYLSGRAGPDELVAAEDIGYIGFYSKKRILDRDGLVSPEVIPYNRNGWYLQVITDHQPEWVVAARPSPMSGFITDSLFLSMYVEDTSFGEGEPVYFVYCRRDLGCEND